MSIQEMIHQLTSLCGLSGAENHLAKTLCQMLENLGVEAKCDNYGNVYGRFQNQKENKKTLLLEAHMDQIGLMVSGFTKEGFVQFVNLGGVDQRILPGMDVTIYGKEPISGVIGACLSKPKKEEDRKYRKIEEYGIDTGFAEEEIKGKVSVGDLIQLQGTTVSMLNGTMSGCAMDNRAGIVSILHCLKKLSEVTPEYNIEVLFSTQEELGLHGAYSGIYGKKIDAAIVVDVTHGITPDAKNEIGVFSLGSGAVICRGPNFHYSYTKQLLNCAVKHGIPHEIEVASAESGTTAWAIQPANGGIPVMLVSIPLRYMHTNVETLTDFDVQAVANLLYHAAMGGIDLA